MSVYVSGPSALAHYRNSSAAVGEDATVEGQPSLKDATSYWSAIGSHTLRSLGIDDPTEDDPLHVLVPRAARRSKTNLVTPHVWSVRLPEAALRMAGKGLFVSSPAFVFLQMSPYLDLPELVELGMELCGTYRRYVRIDSSGIEHDPKTTEYQLPMLTSPSDIEALVTAAGSVRGVKAARLALGYVLPESASPMETILYLLLCLPRRYGGYGLPKPVLNPTIKISKAGRMHTLRRSSRPDLYWPEAKLDLEYNGDEWHDERQRTRDSMRRKALERMNVEVIELTKDEVESAELLHATVLRIAKRLKRQVRPLRERGFVDKRDALRKALLPSDVPAMARQDSSQIAPTAPGYMSDEDVLYEGEASEVPAYDQYPAASDFVDDELDERAFFDDLDDDELVWGQDIQVYMDELG